ncbi:MAG: VCBS repeat-containing protein, partial [Gammaproteobacteria bacterium]|nr:VCBS repeat-containing protein [Gammaproteobacteria bacterium]
VNDGQSASDTASITISVNKNAPSAEILPASSEIFIDDTYAAAIQLGNDATDGPFDYQLLYGPEGMTVSNGGNINWNAHLPDFGVTTQVNYGVVVSNPDKSTTIENTILVKSLPNSLTQTLADPGYVPLADSDFVLLTYASSDGKEQLYTYSPFSGSGFPPSFSLNSDGIIESKYIITELEAGLDYRGKYDLDNDGFPEHILYKEDIVDNPDSSGPSRILISQVWAKSTKDQSLNLLIENLGFTVGLLRFDDINNDGRDDFLIYGSNNESLRVYDTSSLEVMYSLNNVDTPDDSVFCDINQDGLDELINDDAVISLSFGLPLLIKESIGDNTVIHDANGKCRVFSTGSASKELIFENNVFSEVDLILPITPIMSAPMVGNFDSDPEEEFLYFTQNSSTFAQEAVRVDIDGNGDLIATILTQSPDLDYVSRFNYSACFDIDGDGIDEMLYREDDPISGLKVHMVSVTDTDLTQLYSSNRLLGSSTNKLTLYEPTTNTLKHVISDGYRQHSIVNRSFAAEPEIFDLEEDEEPIAAESVGGNHYFYIYRSDNSVPESMVKRHDDVGNTLWSVAYDGILSINPQYTFLKSGVLQLSVYSGIARSIDTNNGSDLLALELSPRNTISPSYFDTTFLYSYDLQNVYELNNNAFESRWSASNDAWDISPNLSSTAIKDIQFVQYDSDPQPEAIIYYREDYANERRYSYVIRDSLSGDFEALDPRINPYFEQSIFESYSTIIDCYSFSLTCRNSFQKVEYADDRFAVIDKLTGKTIWQSPTFAYGYPHIFLQDENGHITAVNRGTVYK